MCGRFALTGTPEEVADFLGHEAGEDFPPRYNIAPTQPILVLREERGRRVPVLMRWGLVPAWAKEPARFSLLINARAESAAEKPAFANALRYRRCLIPASGFYEWQRGAPWWLAAGGGLVAFAGLWETWSGPDGSEIDTACILTTAATPDIAHLHHRMPAVVAPEDFGRWLSVRETSAAAALALIRTPPAGLFTPMPVGEAVNAVRNDGPDLQQPPGPRQPSPGGQLSLF